ncbi:MAG: serine/threonine protein kinase [Hydrocarboniphaga sp.]|uniref:serine/threonine-protein kinase n=1 Tax=Hydrocarboniphaga sp. TaxID=2033016 RepID=UPI0026216233|nr:serine/threonine-protein kinase [Hydrocarboniphaga sp.]MDB5971582.1 serine/threonine protein kinase [Hydrocarboniphaga sp.]
MKKPKQIRTTYSNYYIDDLLGEGGSGVVYGATDDEKAHFAIKFIAPEKASGEKLKRFKNELSFCSKHTHPCLIRVVDNGITLEGAPFFVMPRYEGSLKRLMGKLEPDRAMRIYSRILDGVEAAHKLGVVHRDIKPENILINSEGDAAVLADFGIAHFEEEELFTAVETKQQSRLANFEYAAPEQRSRGTAVGAAADIYALGLILNELFTGKVPHGTGFQRVQSFSEKHAYVDQIVERMLAQDPKGRPASIEDIKKELISMGEAYVSLQKVSALEKEVIPAAQVDDPIEADPMRIAGIDWTDGTLTISLSHPVNPRWKWAFTNMGGQTAVLGKGPEAFSFGDRRASIRADEGEAQRIIDYFKQWMPVVHQVYARRLRDDLQREEQEKRAALEAAKKKELDRAKLLSSLRF